LLFFVIFAQNILKTEPIRPQFTEPDLTEPDGFAAPHIGLQTEPNRFADMLSVPVAAIVALQ
jgi:hypothetical protein